MEIAPGSVPCRLNQNQRSGDGLLQPIESFVEQWVRPQIESGSRARMTSNSLLETRVSGRACQGGGVAGHAVHGSDLTIDAPTSAVEGRCQTWRIARGGRPGLAVPIDLWHERWRRCKVAGQRVRAGADGRLPGSLECNAIGESFVWLGCCARQALLRPRIGVSFAVRAGRESVLKKDSPLNGLRERTFVGKRRFWDPAPPVR